MYKKQYNSVFHILFSRARHKIPPSVTHTSFLIKKKIGQETIFLYAWLKNFRKMTFTHLFLKILLIDINICNKLLFKHQTRMNIKYVNNEFSHSTF